MELLEAPLASAEYLAVDTETNGLGADACEITEIGAVLVGGGELHDRWSSLVRPSAPLRRGIQRFTGITQAMVDEAPWPDEVLPTLAVQLEGRVMVAHNAAFDRRVLRQAFSRVGLDWPHPPVICTAALARTLLPLQRERRLTVLADALGIEVRQAHRALADAETCARVLCALLPRLRANALTVAEGISALKPRRPSRRRSRAAARHGVLPAGASPEALPDFGELPRDPGVYLFRDAGGRVLYVGKSVSIRSRARAHFAPSAPPAGWTAHATVVDYRTTRSELGALILENRLIKELSPPGNERLVRSDDRLLYIRCRLDIPYPILEVSPDPAAGHAVSIGPVRGRRLALELIEQLDSLFGLRHCGRRLPRRQHPSAYGQMGRCLSPCLGDLDPNLYRRRLDEALRLFVGAAEAGGGETGGGETGGGEAAAGETSRAGGPAGELLLAHVDRQMRAAAAELRFERAAALRRRRRRLGTILARLDGVLEATHARPRLLLVPHPSQAEFDAFWVTGGRLVDWGPLASDDADGLEARTRTALARGGRLGELGAHVPPGEVDEVRILGTWLAAHPETAQLALAPAPDPERLARFLSDAAGAAREPASGPKGKLDHDGADLVLAHGDV